jgi:hypothetical protein
VDPVGFLRVGLG